LAIQGSRTVIVGKELALRRALITILSCLVFATPSLASEKTKTSLAEIEPEVMCVECRTPLSTSSSPVADRERALILRLIKQGKSKEEIKSKLVNEYGTRVLAVPQKDGFNIVAYLVPIILGVLALGGIIIAVIRWRRNSPAQDEEFGTTQAQTSANK
jgi:cytochrome c-type biogenesis protein CcmH